jgi:hypothetical protein
VVDCTPATSEYFYCPGHSEFPAWSSLTPDEDKHKDCGMKLCFSMIGKLVPTQTLLNRIDSENQNVAIFLLENVTIGVPNWKHVIHFMIGALAHLW